MGDLNDRDLENVPGTEVWSGLVSLLSCEPQRVALPSLSEGAVYLMRTSKWLIFTEVENRDNSNTFAIFE